jgi:NAD(P)-dependent dehydrogenase (short-subunit alcohol dehydrogenase family)
MADLIDLADRVVIVTGASSGIGASTARLLHAAGAHPVLAARRADRLAALSEELDGALAVPTDVTDRAQVRDLVAAALDRHQRIDGLVNNAGASLHGPLDQVDVTQFSRILFAGGRFRLGASPRPGMVAHSPDYVAGVVLRLLRTGEESFDIPHGPEQPGLAEVIS